MTASVCYESHELYSLCIISTDTEQRSVLHLKAKAVPLHAMEALGGEEA
jgi:hypothetical protein